MKKLVLFVSVLTVVFISCNPNSSNSVATKNTAPTKILANVNNISSKEAEAMTHNYKPHSGTVPHLPAPNNFNSRCVWFDKTKLTEFVDAINKEKDCDGVRIYFATYPDTEPEPTDHSHPSYRNYNTIVLISTKASSAPKHHHDDYFTNEKKAAFLVEPVNKGELNPPGQDEGAKFLQNNGLH